MPPDLRDYFGELPVRADGDRFLLDLPGRYDQPFTINEDEALAATLHQLAVRSFAEAGRVEPDSFLSLEVTLFKDRWPVLHLPMIGSSRRFSFGQGKARTLAANAEQVARFKDAAREAHKKIADMRAGKSESARATSVHGNAYVNFYIKKRPGTGRATHPTSARAVVEVTYLGHQRAPYSNDPRANRPMHTRRVTLTLDAMRQWWAACAAHIEAAEIRARIVAGEDLPVPDAKQVTVEALEGGYLRGQIRRDMVRGGGRIAGFCRPG